MALEIGDRVGPYEILDELGEGRYGIVYLVEDTEDALRQRYALKLLHSRVASDKAKLLREGELWRAACLNYSPNVVRFYRMAPYERNRTQRHYHLCEYISGGTLRDWLDGHQGKAPDLVQALALMEGILQGLTHLHSSVVSGADGTEQHGIIHRDLKPDNVLLDGMTPKITDFGLSRVMNASLSRQAGKGAMAYASPEDLRGENPTISMDLWSSAVMFYEMLTARTPFGSRDAEIGRRVLDDRYDPLPENLPPGIIAVLDRALQKDPKNRFSNAEEFRKALEDAHPHRVFISYTHDSPAHRKQVLALAQRLRSEGLLCEIDQFYEDSPPLKGWPRWMDGEMRRSRYVLTVCTPTYLRRFLAEEEPGRGLGAVWEGGIITQELYNQQGKNHKFIPVFFNTADSASIPEVLQGTTYYNVGSDSGYDSLYYRLTNQRDPEKEPASVGKVRKRPETVSVPAVVVKPPLPVSGYAARASVSPKLFTPPLTLAEYKAQMVTIPAGEFLRGDDDISDTKPKTTIYLSEYQIGIVPVTVGMYREFIAKADGVWPTEPDFNKDWGKSDHPMVNVSWQNASRYAAWAGLKLPTEAQWEKAARGEDRRNFSWGEDWNSELLHGPDNKDRYGGGTAPVGSYPNGESPYHVLDMAGNVWEWCEDWYQEDWYAYAKQSDPIGPSEGEKRVLRGGSWKTVDPSRFRCAVRAYNWPDLAGGSRGFRLVSDKKPPPLFLIEIPFWQGNRYLSGVERGR